MGYLDYPFGKEFEAKFGVQKDGRRAGESLGGRALGLGNAMPRRLGSGMERGVVSMIPRPVSVR